MRLLDAAALRGDRLPFDDGVRAGLRILTVRLALYLGMSLGIGCLLLALLFVIDKLT